MNKRVMRRFAAKLAHSIVDFVISVIVLTIALAVVFATIAGFAWLAEALFGFVEVNKWVVGFIMAVGFGFVVPPVFEIYSKAEKEIEVEDHNIMAILKGDNE